MTGSPAEGPQTSAGVGWSEADRLSALRAYSILDTAPEPEFDEITEIAALVCKAPIALVSLVAETRQFFKSEVGIGVREMPIEMSICAHAIRERDLFVAPDMEKDPRFACNPLVADGPRLRFYAGAPLVTPEGLPIGTVCVLDHEPRPQGLTAEQGMTLRALARAAMAQLERKRVTGALAQSEERYRLAVAAFHGETYDSDLESGYAHHTPRFDEMLGVHPGDGEPTREWWFTRLHPDDAPRFHEALRDLLNGTAAQLDVEFRVRHENGGWIWVWQRGLLLRDAEGRPKRIAGALLDITERKKVDERLRASEALKGAILEAALDCIITIDHDSRIVEWNPAAERTFGYTRQAALGCDLAELIIPPELKDTHRRGMARFLATGEGPVLGKRVELEAVRADGSRFPVELAISAIEIGAKPHFTAYLRDITSRREAEENLRESDQRLKATYERAFAGIAEVDADGRYLRVNEQFSSVTGYSREELLARSFADITHPEDRERDRAQFHRLMAGEVEAYTLEKRYVHKEGHTVWIDLAASHVGGADGRPLYGIRVVRDVTDRKQAEDELYQLAAELERRVEERTAQLVQTNAELSAFAYSISHDLRAPIRAMEGYAEALIEDHGGQLDGEARLYLERIVAAAHRMNRLVEDLLAYSRLSQGEVVLRPVSLAQVVAEALQEITTEKPDTAHIDADGLAQIVRANPTTLRQAIINLVSNAVKFVPPGTMPHVRLRAEERGEGMVRLWVEDNGIGLASEHLERIFGVFERLHSREAYPGSGIGLAIVRRSMERMGGACGVESELGKGSRFWIELAKVEDAE